MAYFTPASPGSPRILPTKTQLAAFERAEKILSEQHKFCLNWFINSGTVISQSTANSTFLALSQPSTLIAYSF